ncbi:MAG: hypothetical protein PVI13_08665 [Desulfobacterales bacterium]
MRQFEPARPARDFTALCKATQARIRVLYAEGRQVITGGLVFQQQTVRIGRQP